MCVNSCERRPRVASVGIGADIDVDLARTHRCRHRLGIVECKHRRRCGRSLFLHRKHRHRHKHGHMYGIYIIDIGIHMCMDTCMDVDFVLQV